MNRFIRNYGIEVLLLAAVLIGAIVRVWRIADIPFPPNDSELFFGYYGWSLLHFHIDEFGTRWPLNFPSIGDFKYPGLAYLNIIPAAIFGLSFITARFWSVLTGILLVPAIYLLSLLIFKNKLAALASAWVIAFSPWSIVLSRIGYENHVAMVLTVTGIILLLTPYLSLDGTGIFYAKLTDYAAKNKKLFLITSFTLLLLATFTYAAERLFIPAFLFLLFLITFFKESKLRKIRKTVFSFFVVLALITVAFLIPWQNRGRTASIIYTKLDSQEANRQQELIQESGLSPIRTPVLLTRILQSKYRIMFFHLIARYAYHFSPDYLFFKGDTSYERVPDTGQLLLVELILLPLGLLAIFAKKYLPGSLLVIFWLLLSPLSSTITLGGAVNRASLMIPSLGLISGLGFSFIVATARKLRGLILALILAGFIFSVTYSLYQIFVIKPIHQAWYTEVVNQQMVTDVMKIKNKYLAVVVPKDEYIFFLFYGKISPLEFLADSEIKPLDRQNPWDRVNRYSNIHFNMAGDCPSSGKNGVLYLCRGQNIPQNSKVLEVIRFRDGVPAYTFLIFYPISEMKNPLPVLPDGLRYMVDLESNTERRDGMISDNSSEWW